MNDAEIKMFLKNFLDAEEKLIAFPAKRKKKLYALIYLSGKLEAEHEYTEREINEALSNWHTFADSATLRRELYNSNSSAFGFLLQTSSHAKPLRGGLMHLCHYIISRTLQQVQSPGLNCYVQLQIS